MIVLDTNVVSELMKGAPQPEVLAWAKGQARNTLFITTITEAEIRAGIAVLPEGHRRRILAAAAEHILDVSFAGHILPFDSAASHTYGSIVADRRTVGRPISTQDCLIAAIARAHGAGVATRNVSDFEGCGIEVTNPWDG
ncbi:MAG: type II toxin-antitoxin system VapC family toxin [Chloroflexi bacterium]|nr:type II toxin-antitoxin system VapC family toxin [Chloroflexota bacterium]MYB85056.1 type II toxin-antitoxin system VapC family toxin [Chloroflexota bacterium]